MHIDIITCLPKLIESPFSDSILKRAQKKGLVSVDIIDLRSYSTDKHKSVDDYAFGGGAGMVMTAPPIVSGCNPSVTGPVRSGNIARNTVTPTNATIAGL